jgi:molybdenum cofactor cytidylyltransferase
MAIPIMAPSAFAIVLLAAGLSRRMGGPNKLLQPYRSEPLLTHALNAAEEAGLGDRIVVTGRDSAEIGALAGRHGFRATHNADCAAGLGGSIAAGVRALHGEEDGLFIALGDMPDVRADDYRLIASRFWRRAIVVPIHKGTRGHPVLLCSTYLPDLAALSGDKGARCILRRHAAHIVRVETQNPGILRDLDTPEDFQER